MAESRIWSTFLFRNPLSTTKIVLEVRKENIQETWKQPNSWLTQSVWVGLEQRLKGKTGLRVPGNTEPAWSGPRIQGEKPLVSMRGWICVYEGEFGGVPKSHERTRQGLKRKWRNYAIFAKAALESGRWYCSWRRWVLSASLLTIKLAKPTSSCWVGGKATRQREIQVDDWPSSLLCTLCLIMF